MTSNELSEMIILLKTLSKWSMKKSYFLIFREDLVENAIN